MRTRNEEIILEEVQQTVKGREINSYAEFMYRAGLKSISLTHVLKESVSKYASMEAILINKTRTRGKVSRSPQPVGVVLWGPMDWLHNVLQKFVERLWK